MTNDSKSTNETTLGRSVTKVLDREVTVSKNTGDKITSLLHSSKTRNDDSRLTNLLQEVLIVEKVVAIKHLSRISQSEVRLPDRINVSSINLTAIFLVSVGVPLVVICVVIEDAVLTEIIVLAHNKQEIVVSHLANLLSEIRINGGALHTPIRGTFGRNLVKNPNQVKTKLSLFDLIHNFLDGAGNLLD